VKIDRIQHPGCLTAAVNPGEQGYSVKKNIVCIVSGMFLAGLIVSGINASAQGTVPRISIQELKKMMDSGKPVTIIDAQPKDVFKEGHIKGAISLPWRSQIPLEDVWNIPKDKPIVTYCDCGPGESDSADVAAQLIQYGYDDVKVLGDPSIKGWKQAGYPTEKSK
jgi:rhodanese-related sulfurtransferase